MNILTSGLSIATVLLFTACNSSSDKEEETAAQITVDTTSTYATRSAANYSENTYGLTSAVNAAKMITDWENNKPEGKRKLFVMQYGNIYGFDGTHEEPISATETMTMNNGYVKSNADAGVYVFDRTSGCTDTGDFRGDGVSSIPKPVFSINQMDQAFAAYGIDPEQDVIMLTLGAPDQSKAGNYMAGVARMWYTLTYWGFPQESIMMLNGQASNVLNPDVNADIAALDITREDIFTSLPSDYPQDLVQGEDWESISTIKRDGTIVQATMKDMMDVVDAATGTDLILDARSEAEYLGTKKAKTEYSVCGEADENGTKTGQCYAAFDGHIKGAVNLYYTDVMNIDDGAVDINDDNVTDYRDATFSFKALDAIETEFANVGYSAGDTVYTYCRTGTKASLLTYTSAAILGYKTRIYDGSWIQWGKMANRADTNGDILVPEGNMWLTDAYSESVIYQPDSSLVSPLNQDLLDLDAENTDKIINEDKAAKE